MDQTNYPVTPTWVEVGLNWDGSWVGLFFFSRLRLVWAVPEDRTIVWCSSDKALFSKYSGDKLEWFSITNIRPQQ